MVKAMLARGDRVTVWNRTESKARALERFGAIVAATPDEAVAAGDHVHLALPDDAVVDEMVAALRAASQTPRRRPRSLDDVAGAGPGSACRACRRRASGFSTAPVFMSPQMPRLEGHDARLGSASRSSPASPPSSRKMTGEVWYLGERPELAASYKIFGNSMLFVIAAGIADVFAMAKGLGIAPADALPVFSKFNAAGVIPSRGEKMARGDFSATFELTMARKDMRLMLEAAGDQPLTVLPSIANRMDQAIADGHGQDDLGAIAAGLV